jgi:uncharacterized LabA/DUF88 family protein
MEERRERGVSESLERVAVFIEWPNIEMAFRALGCSVDPAALRAYLTEGRWETETFIYLGVDPRQPQTREPLIRSLRSEGFLVRTKRARVNGDGSLKCDFDVALALDAWDFAREVHPSVIVIASGDRDYVPLVERLRLQGIRVEIAATPDAMSHELLEAANDFVDLTQMEEEPPLTSEELEPEGLAQEASEPEAENAQ